MDRLKAFPPEKTRLVERQRLFGTFEEGPCQRARALEEDFPDP
ncbi:hypothetical protein [Salinibacter sp.]